jgi:cytochrome c
LLSSRLRRPHSKSSFFPKPLGFDTIQEIGATNGFSVTATEDASQFTDSNLGQFGCVIFAMTTGDVLDDVQQAAFERYIRAGGGYVGIHSASDTEYAWPWYGQLVGAYFKSHPSIQQATIKLNDFVHPSTEGLPKRWIRTDEWYSFQSNPRGKVHVLATLDEKTYTQVDSMGFDHPIGWCQEFDGGRSWYTGAGHTQGSYVEPAFRQHLTGGILWAAKAKLGDAGATIDNNYQKVILDSAPKDPMQLAIAPDGRVFFVERAGTLKVWKPDSRSTLVAGQVAIDEGREDGLLGIALDTGFATNHWLYLFYSPAGTDPVQHVSRFTINGDTLDLTSEKVLLTVPVQRETCCHSSGSLEMNDNGDLYVGVGDNTNPFESSGFDPIDERPGRSSWDAQKSAGNANDLRGKILRIHPETNGTYTIPTGNLFPSGTVSTRPEIFTMGNRNPFRFSVDPATGWLYWGEVGPDANNDDSYRGPRGYDEWNQARSPGNYGWPYFVADNQAYREYDFASLISGPAFDPAAPLNNSPNNTGPMNLPSARTAWIWYPYYY